MNQEKIGKFIAELRKEKNMTQQDLADKLGITKNAVSKWERGICLMDISLLKPVSEIFNVNVSELLNGEKIEKIDTNIINDTFTKGANIYMKQARKKVTIKILSIISILIIIVLCVFELISEYNYGIIPLGSKAYIEYSNISSNVSKKKADKYIELLINKDVDTLDSYVVSNNIYLMKDGLMTEEKWNLLEEKTHSQSYAENLKEFYKNVKILNNKYQFFYHDGTNYVFSYLLKVEYNGKNYDINIQILPHKENVELVSFGSQNGEIEIYSEFYNLLYSVFYW